MRSLKCAVAWAALLSPAACDAQAPDTPSDTPSVVAGVAPPVQTNDSAAGDVAGIRFASDWPGFLGPTGDSKSPETGVLTRWPASGPPLRWQMTLGEGYCAPTVAGGRLYMFHRDGGQYILDCVDAENGAPIWEFKYPASYRDMLGYDGGPRACPVVDDDRVYILGPEGVLHCLSAADGAVKWKLDTMAEFNVVQNFFGVGAAPVIEGDLLIMQVGGSPPGSPPTVYDGPVEGNGSGVVAFNKHTGEVVYKITNELASYSVPTLATIDGRRWCFVFARGGLIGFEPMRGEIDFYYPWRAPILESVNAANPVVVGDRVFISECYGVGSSLLKVRPGDYEVIWKDSDNRRAVMATHWNTPIHIDGYLYACTGRHSGGAELRCIELETGRIMWSVQRLDDGEFVQRCSLTYVDGHFICLSEEGFLLLIRVNPQKFDLAARFTPVDSTGNQLLQPHAWAAPVISRGLLYVRGKGRLICLDLRSGT